MPNPKRKRVLCPACRGTGELPQTTSVPSDDPIAGLECPACQGAGEVPASNRRRALESAGDRSVVPGGLRELASSSNDPAKRVPADVPNRRRALALAVEAYASELEREGYEAQRHPDEPIIRVKGVLTVAKRLRAILEEHDA